MFANRNPQTDSRTNPQEGIDMMHAFPTPLPGIATAAAARKSVAVHSMSARAPALAAMLLALATMLPASPAAHAEIPARSFQGQVMLAQLDQPANYCVSFEWAEQHSCSEGGISHRFILTNHCSRAVLFSWNDNGRHCRRRSDNYTPCAILVHAGGRNADYVNCASGDADINYRSVFAE